MNDATDAAGHAADRALPRDNPDVDQDGSDPAAPVVKPWEQVKDGQGSSGDALAARFVESVSYDRRLYRQDITGSLAHADMLHQVGLLSDQELGQIYEGLKQIQAQIEAAQVGDTNHWAGWKTELEDVHMCIEAALIEWVGDAGRKLHTGRSRNDQVALDLKLWIGDAVAYLDGVFHRLFGALVGLAQRDGRVVMPSYTHLQRAQPIVVGGELMAWLAGLDRAHRRLGVLRELNLDNPLGSGAIAGSGLALDRQATAAALGVGPPSLNSIDATATRDVAIDFVYGLAMTAMVLSRWAEQWILYASTEFGFIQLDGRYTTGSSMMPQKANPDMLELIRGRCGGVYGHLTALLTLCKGLPLGYNRDLQEDKRHLFMAFDTVVDCLEMSSRVIVTARFDEDRIKATLSRGFLDATSLADYLVGRSVPFRTAHQIVGSLVRQCQSSGLEGLSQLEVEDLNQTCQAFGFGGSLCDAGVYDWLGAANVVERYATAGNAGVQGFEQQLGRWRHRLEGTASAGIHRKP